jgi:hypothetical protein
MNTSTQLQGMEFDLANKNVWHLLIEMDTRGIVLKNVDDFSGVIPNLIKLYYECEADPVYKKRVFAKANRLLAPFISIDGESCYKVHNPHTGIRVKKVGLRDINIYPFHLTFFLSNYDNLRTLPTIEVIRHICDINNCINPKHLVAGSHADNALDRTRSGHGYGQKQSIPTLIKLYGLLLSDEDFDIYQFFLDNRGLLIATTYFSIVSTQCNMNNYSKEDYIKMLQRFRFLLDKYGSEIGILRPYTTELSIKFGGYTSGAPTELINHYSLLCRKSPYTIRSWIRRTRRSTLASTSKEKGNVGSGLRGGEEGASNSRTETPEGIPIILSDQPIQDVCEGI